MKFLMLTSLIILSGLAQAGEYGEIVLPYTLECKSTQSEDLIVVEVEHMRATLNAGPGYLHLNGNPFTHGGWKTSLVPDGYRTSGMTNFSFKGIDASVDLILNPINDKGWGHANLKGKTFLLDCQFTQL